MALRLHMAAAIAIVVLAMDMGVSATFFKHRKPKGGQCPELNKDSCKCDSDAGVVSGGFYSHAYPIEFCPHVPTQADCCKKCAKKTGCYYFTYDHACKECKLYNAWACKRGNAYGLVTDSIVLGGPCSPECKDDPHFVGAHGVKYDFNGVPDESFCLITDKQLHVNMRITGYYTEDKTLRSWIRELVFFWRVGEVKHTLEITARSGASIERGDGFVSKIVFNGAIIERMQPDDVFSNSESGLTIVMKPVTKFGEYDMDSYSLSIDSLLEAVLQARVAHKLLRLPDEAETHLNLRIVSISNTDDIHGVLGQTFRVDREERTEKFQKIVDILHAPIHADQEDGNGFLDGELKDYETHDPLSTSCSFDRFNADSAGVVEDQSA